MADYATTTHVYALLPQITFDASSYPTVTQLTGVHIPAVTGEMNARFSAVGISTPITTSATSNAYLYVNRLASLKVACIAENAAFEGGNGVPWLGRIAVEQTCGISVYCQRRHTGDISKCGSDWILTAR